MAPKTKTERSHSRSKRKASRSSSTELAVLGLLLERPRHGYEVRQQLTEIMGFTKSVSFGSVYPILKKMELQSLIEALNSEEQGGRRKRAYQLTSQGEERFFELLAEETPGVEDERSFAVRMAFFGHTKPERRVRLLEKHKTKLEDRLTNLEQANRDMQEDLYLASYFENRSEIARLELQWINNLLEQERAQIKDANGGTL